MVSEYSIVLLLGSQIVWKQSAVTLRKAAEPP